MPNCRDSFWTRTFTAARTTGDWHRVGRHYTRATAVQIASDISCAHTRPAHRHRLRGIEAGERWEARWELATDGAPDDLVIWIRLVATDPVDTASPSAAPFAELADTRADGLDDELADEFAD